MIITVWETWHKGEWLHNHIEDGYDPGVVVPKVTSPAQRGWVDQTWKATKAQLINGKVVI